MQSDFKTSAVEQPQGEPNPTANATMGEVIAARFSRRQVLQGSLAISAIAATVGPAALLAAEFVPVKTEDLPKSGHGYP